MLTPTPKAPLLISKWFLLQCRDTWGVVLKELFCKDLSIWVFLRLAHLEGNRTSFAWRSLRALEIKGSRREVTDCSVFKSNQVLEFLWSAKWGHGGREWQSHYLKMLLRPGGLQTKPGNVKGNESLKIILCNPFILAYSINSSEAMQRPALCETSRMWQ